MKGNNRRDIALLGLGVLYSLMAQSFYDTLKETLKGVLDFAGHSYMYPLIAGFLVFPIMIGILFMLMRLWRE